MEARAASWYNGYTYNGIEVIIIGTKRKIALLVAVVLVPILLITSCWQLPEWLRSSRGSGAHASDLVNGELVEETPEPSPTPSKDLPPFDLMPLYLQNQLPWSTLKINPDHPKSNTYAGAGCGYAAWAMVLSWYLQRPLTPYEFANTEVPGKGPIYRSYVGSGIPQFDVTADVNEVWGLSATVYKTDHYEIIKQELDKGLPVIASTASSQWAANAHVVVFVRWADREKETVIVHDPNSRNNWLRWQKKHIAAGNEELANAYETARGFMRNNGEGWPLTDFAPWGATVVTLGIE